jgi:hypothetical protein
MALGLERKFSTWQLGFNLDLFAVLYTVSFSSSPSFFFLLNFHGQIIDCTPGMEVDSLLRYTVPRSSGSGFLQALCMFCR